MFSELERLEGYYQIMGFLNGVKEVFSIGSTLDRMNQGIDGVVNYKSCSVENFFESQYGTINTIVSGQFRRPPAALLMLTVRKSRRCVVIDLAMAHRSLFILAKFPHVCLVRRSGISKASSLRHFVRR